MLSGARALSCFVIGACLSACTTPRTEVVLAIETDLTWGVDQDVTSLVIDVRRGGPTGAQRYQQWVHLGARPDRAPLPYVMGLLPRGGDTSGSVWIQVLACHRDGAACTVDDAVVTQQAVVSWLPGRTQLIRMLLSRRCIPLRTCPATQSCDPDEARCVDLDAVGRRTSLPDDSTEVRFDASAFDRIPLDAASDAATSEVVADAPSTDARADAVSDAPQRDVVDVPVIDVPAIDVPVIDVPVIDVPVIDVPVIDATVIDAPVIDTPVIDTPVIDVPAMDTPAIDTPAIDTPAVDAPAADVPAALRQRSCPDPMERGCGMATFERATLTLGGGTSETQSTPVQPDVTVDGFALDRHEVTLARFQRFWRARADGGVTTPVTLRYRRGASTYDLSITGPLNTEADLAFASSCAWNEPSRWSTRPMACVNWYTAQAFCAWDGGRLPTEAEWERAARGTTGRTYPWGSEPPSSSRVCWSDPDAGERPETCDVGSYPLGATPEGVYDLAGSMIEFVADAFEDYRGDGAGCWGATAQTNPLCTTVSTERATRSCSWRTGFVPYFTGWNRDHKGVDYFHNELGFRCARSL